MNTLKLNKIGSHFLQSPTTEYLFEAMTGQFAVLVLHLHAPIFVPKLVNSSKHNYEIYKF